MTAGEVSDETLALRLSVDRTTISRIRRGARMPSPGMMRKLHDETGGAVTANDFVHTCPAPAEAEPRAASEAA